MANTSQDDSRRLFSRAMVVLAAIALALLTWQLTSLLLLLFASILAAIIFHDFAIFMQKRLRLPFGVALLVAILLPLLLVLTVFGLFGSLLVDQFANLTKQLPAAVASIEAWLKSSATGREIIAGAGSYAPEAGTVIGYVQSLLSNLGSGLSSLAVVLVGGVYLAAQPELYANGLVTLAERAGMASARKTLATIHSALIAWLKAQAVGMAFVAVGTTIGLMLVGVPSALAIGMVAGLCEFVPYLGVILVSAPAVLIGFGIDVQTGILTIVALVVVQQVQGNIVSPLAQGKFADLPPALTIFSLIGAAMLMGPLGAILAVPLTVVIMVLLKNALAPPSA